MLGDVQDKVQCRGCGAQHFAYEAKCPRTGRAILDGPVGTVMGHYRVGRLIGIGGFGTVHEAEDTRSGNLVALKILHRTLVGNPQIVERFAREAETTMRAGNPHIVRVLDASFGMDNAYVALELLRGETLGSALRHGPMPEARAVDIAIQILDGLAVAHDVGVIHRDIKPGNIFLTDSELGPRTVVKILDFGIGRMLADENDQRLTRTGMQLGTPHFTAPEQVLDAKRANERADLYAVAATLFMMLTGERPYGNIAPAEWLLAVHDKKPVRRVNTLIEPVSEALTEVVARGLAIDPEERFSSAHAFSRALLDSTPDAPSRTRAIETIDRASTQLPAPPLHATAAPFVGIDLERAAAKTQALATMDPPQGVEPAATPAPAYSPPQAPPRLDAVAMPPPVPSPATHAPPFYAPPAYPTANAQRPAGRSMSTLVIVAIVAVLFLALLFFGAIAVVGTYWWMQRRSNDTSDTSSPSSDPPRSPSLVPFGVSNSVARCVTENDGLRACTELESPNARCTAGSTPVAACPAPEGNRLTCTMRFGSTRISTRYDRFSPAMEPTLRQSCAETHGVLE